jgi:hypothetical protein
MSDIFISYAREDRDRVKILADGLAAQGWSVWWDSEIPSGRRFSQAIEEALTTARCVVVVWSNSSICSHWVIDEASYGRDRDILVPVLIDRVIPPLGFRQIQSADLTNWNGELTSSDFQKLVIDIGIIINSDNLVNIKKSMLAHKILKEIFIRGNFTFQDWVYVIGCCTFYL